MRPAVPAQIEDLEEAPLLCLLDSGATANRMSAELAELATDEIAVAGLSTTGRCVRVMLTIASHRFRRRSGSATRGRSGSASWARRASSGSSA